MLSSNVPHLALPSISPEESEVPSLQPPYVATAPSIREEPSVTSIFALQFRFLQEPFPTPISPHLPGPISMVFLVDGSATFLLTNTNTAKLNEWPESVSLTLTMTG